MKKTYINPLFTQISIDTNISLVMATGEGSTQIPEDPSFDNKDDNSKQADPFNSPFGD